jgi:hypothetical protein
MKNRTRSHHRQRELFSKQQLNQDPTPSALPVDQSQKLEVAVGELLLDAVSKIKREKGGEHDA